MSARYTLDHLNLRQIIISLIGWAVVPTDSWLPASALTFGMRVCLQESVRKSAKKSESSILASCQWGRTPKIVLTLSFFKKVLEK